MKKIEKWMPTKFIFKKGRLIANPKYVFSGSLHIVNLVASLYQKYICKYVKGSLLDLGCGTVPLYEVYNKYTDKITCVDWDNSLHEINHLDYSKDLNEPLNLTEKFDTIIMSDVLEHIYKPNQLLKECYDLLNNDGCLIMNTPFTYWEHEAPHDYYRFTQYYFKKIASELGFEIEVIEAIGARNIDVVKDLVAKTYQTKKLKLMIVTWLFKKILKRKCLNQPLGYFAVFRKKDKKKANESIEIDIDINEKHDVVVSLTSFPARINIVHLTIESILKQSLKPQKVVLWLAPEQFPNKEADLPQTLLALRDKGLEIDWYHDVRAYKKLIPTLIKYPNNHIVTADDDVIYHKDWLALLYSAYKKNPDMIHGHRGHRAIFKDNAFLPYSQWDLNIRQVPASYKIFLTGVGGIFYPRDCFYKDILDEEKYLKIAPSNDDIWFWAMAILNDKKPNLIDINVPMFEEIENSQDVALWQENVAAGKNDVQLANLLMEYPQIKEILKNV